MTNVYYISFSAEDDLPLASNEPDRGGTSKWTILQNVKYYPMF